VDERPPFEAELIARIGWLIRLRWLATAATALGVGVLAIRLPRTTDWPALLGVTAAVALYNLLLWLHLRSLRSRRSGSLRLRQASRSACLQIVLDLVGLALLVHLAGGVENPMLFFFVFHVIIASILLPRPVSYWTAGLAAILVMAVVGLEYAGLVPHRHLSFLSGELYRDPIHILVRVGALVVTLFLVAYLTSSITTTLRRRDEQLLESKLTCQLGRSELSELNEQLRRLDAERARLMMVVTHELRAPVGVIYSAIELVRGGYAGPEKADEVLGRAQNRAAEMLDLIGDLLNLSKVREQRVRREDAKPIRLEEITRDAVEFHRIDAERRGIALDLSLEPDLPAVRALPEQIKLVWSNLLSNAIKYSPAGSTVQVSLRRDGTRLAGKVRDSGIGIPPEDLPLIFEEFHRANNARQVSRHGTGVGLAIVKRVIEHWGGAITVWSELDRGSEFTFVLPVAEPQA